MYCEQLLKIRKTKFLLEIKNVLNTINFDIPTHLRGVHSGR